MVILANGTGPRFQEGIERLGGVGKAIVASKMDMWGNVRLSYLELLPHYNPESPHDWVDVPPNEIPVYESLVGVPLLGFSNKSTGNITFEIKAFYTTLNVKSLHRICQERVPHLTIMSLQCSKWTDTKSFAQQHPHA